jgi:hypothetical protein
VIHRNDHGFTGLSVDDSFDSDFLAYIHSAPFACIILFKSAFKAQGKKPKKL